MPLRIFGYLFLAIVFSCCSGTNSAEYVKISGETMGTTYHITCSCSNINQLKDQVEYELSEVNTAVNTYDPNSLISKFNLSAEGMTFDLESISAKHFYANTMASRKIVKETNGVFDPTVAPLVNFWGFGPTARNDLEKVDSTSIDSIMKLISFNRILIKKDNNSFSVDKSSPGVQLDFSAIAKGYGVDVIAGLLEDQGVKNYLIEIGGETRLAGLNPKGQLWSLAISEPRIDASENTIARILTISDRAIATSGNYRNYYEIGGITYSHTINPFTGYPERSSLLSATIVHDECMYADAYATACMVMGLERSLQFVNTHPEISYLFLFTDENGNLRSEDSGDLTFRD